MRNVNRQHFPVFLNIRVTVNMRFNYFLLNKTRMHWAFMIAPELNIFDIDALIGKLH